MSATVGSGGLKRLLGPCAVPRSPSGRFLAPLTRQNRPNPYRHLSSSSASCLSPPSQRHPRNPLQCLHLTRRPFSTTSPLAGGKWASMPTPKEVRKARKATDEYTRYNHRKRLKEPARLPQAIKKTREGRSEDDLGILPGTLVMPTGKNRISWQEYPLANLRMERSRLLKRVQDLRGHRRSTNPPPQKTSADIPTIERTTVKGQLRENLISSLQARQFMQPHSSDPPQKTPTNTTPLSPLPSASQNPPRYTWTLHKYTKSPQIVSHRGTPIPVDVFHDKDSKDRQSSIRQFVVRIDSIQSFVPVDAEGNEIPVPDESATPSSSTAPSATESQDTVLPYSPYHTTRPIHELYSCNDPHKRPLPPAKHVARQIPVREYLVLQKIVRLGEESDWAIWGTTKETSLDERGPDGWEYVFEGKGLKGYHMLSRQGMLIRDRREFAAVKREEQREDLERKIDKERSALGRKEFRMQGRKLGWLYRLLYGGGTLDVESAVNSARKASEDKIKSIAAEMRGTKDPKEEKKYGSLTRWLYGGGVEKSPKDKGKDPQNEGRPSRAWLTRLVNERNRKLARLQARKRVGGGRKATPTPA
ncbi:MAG: hypothetical protein M1831_000725 [Alyxoria varia]|nr:MAG: hypothetical protein M1831_000725 [Alyxoria varia]